MAQATRLAVSNMGLGEGLSLASAATWALGVIIYRRLGESLNPIELNVYKNLIVALLMVPTVLLAHGWGLPQLDGRQWCLVIASGVLGIGVADTCYFHALNRLGAGRIGILGNLFSPFVITLSFVFLDERLSLLQGAGFALVMMGVVLVHRRARRPVEGTAPIPWSGLLLGVLAIFLNAAGVVMIKRVLEDGPFFWIAQLRLLAALLPMAIAWHWFARWRKSPPRGVAPPWGLLLLGAFLGQYLAMLLWLGGYRYTDASVASVLNETASVFILLFAWWLLREPLERAKLLGVTLTFAGVSLMLM